MADRQERSVGLWVALSVLSVLIVLLLMRLPSELTGGRPTFDATGTATAMASTAPPADFVSCAPASSAPAVHVDTHTPKRSDEVDTIPFAVEIGGVAAHRGGYAVGLKREVKDGTMAEVLMLDEHGSHAGVLSLGRLRGDVGPPILAAMGDQLMASVLEPNASGIAGRLVAIRDGKTHWGMEFELGRTESFGADLVVGPDETFIVYDDLVEDGKRSQISLRSVTTGDAKANGKPRVLSAPGVDAEMPRLVARAGGYWLAYVSRGRAAGEPLPAQGGAKPTGRYAAEAIEPSRIEILRLDKEARPQGEARAVTPLGGHVLAYDLKAVADDGLLLAWRDDDTPSGSGGGELSVLRIDLSGAGERQLVVRDDIGAGVPQLIGTWLAYANRRDELRLAHLDDRGLIGNSPARPSLFARAQWLVGRGEDILLAHPRGTGVEFSLLRCP